MKDLISNILQPNNLNEITYSNVGSRFYFANFIFTQTKTVIQHNKRMVE
jgi:hypothetical protein